MPRQIATTTVVDRDGMLEFVRPRHSMVLVTTRSDGRPQTSPVTGGVDEQGRIVVSTYPERAKTTNARRRPQVSRGGACPCSRRRGRPCGGRRRGGRGTGRCRA